MRIAVGMSGGVDSSVVAFLLKSQGHDVIGITLRFHKEYCSEDARVCCSPKDVQDARIVCDKIGIPHLTLDWEDLFRQKVIDFFVKNYELGLTPNPCAICNKEVKTAFLSFYLKSVADIDFLATGHYVIKEDNKIKRAKHKDQSYFMALLPKKSFENLIFPIGHMTKEQVRNLAKAANLPVADKLESQDVCFLQGKSLEEYLDKFITSRPGYIVHIASGKILGMHKGLHKYTIGQRKSLGISYSAPLYVIDKDVKDNIIYVGEREFLAKNEVYLKDYNEIEPLEKDNLFLQIRYNSNPVLIDYIRQEKDGVRISLKESVFQLAPGQVGAIYHNDILIGGGIIS